MATKDGLTVKTRNIFDQEVEVYIGLAKKENHAWDEKKKTENCSDCPSCIGTEEAKRILKIIKKKKTQNGFIPPPENFILGLCMWTCWAKILILSTIEGYRKCRYFKNE
ncbi:MAG TPA: hypothetical protein VMV66_01685 [Candidatus Humimicrobiaceae bacterium]|nr:hypothetical protein [Candidatus Humimicrobiaceae bacterium]